ncbi:hypothetical protein [Ruminococcus intestinalis]|uniref:hypothetical protein n=1 Tax=Ruminococcus intestinalis TaxID=2763066 RepID=UPI003F7D3E0A
MTELKNQNSEKNTKYFGIGVGLLAATVCVFTLILYLGYLLKYAFIIPFISILVITSFIVMVVTAKRRADSLSNTYIACYPFTCYRRNMAINLDLQNNKFY